MKDIALIVIHLAVTVAKLLGPGGARAVIAENLLLKKQLTVLRRSRRRAPNPDPIRPISIRLRGPVSHPSTLEQGRYCVAAINPSEVPRRVGSTKIPPSVLLAQSAPETWA